MRPRLFSRADLELQHFSAELRRAYSPAPAKRQFRFQFLEPGLVIVGVVLILVTLLFMAVWTPSIDTAALMRINNAPNSAASPAPTPKSVTQLGDSFTLPDKRHSLATYIGQHSRWEDLPWTANHVGDARYVWEAKQWYIWLVPAGSEDGTPAWINPWRPVERHYIGECLGLKLPDGQFVYPILRGWVDDWRHLPTTDNRLDNDAWIDRNGHIWVWAIPRNHRDLNFAFGSQLATEPTWIDP
jgi:hypothetical protein